MTWPEHSTRQLPPNWQATRRRILARDGHRCTWTDNNERCTVTGDKNLEVDHIGSRDDHRPEMLRSLCHPHHARRTAVQALAARPRTARPSEHHPGLTG